MIHIVTLPDGRRVEMVDRGILEEDVNAWVSGAGYPKFYWHPSGRELTDVECSEKIDGSYTHEWVAERYDGYSCVDDSDDDQPEYWDY